MDSIVYVDKIILQKETNVTYVESIMFFLSSLVNIEMKQT